MQIVTVPDDSEFHAEVASGNSNRTITLANAVRWIRSAITRKRSKYAAADSRQDDPCADARRAPHDESVVAELKAQRAELEAYGFAGY